MELKGTVKIVYGDQQITQNFRTREMVLTTDEQYAQHLTIQFQNDRCDLLDKVWPGEAVVIKIGIRGREWINPQGEAKYFNTILGWSIKKISTQTTPAQPARNTENQNNSNIGDGPDDIPF